jgi:hypothetical protein
VPRLRAAAPWEKNCVSGDGGGVGFGGCEQFATGEPADGGLHGAAGEAGVFGELLVADGDGRFAAGLLAGQPEVGEEGCGAVVVAGEVAEEGVEDVVVEFGLSWCRLGHGCTNE